MNCDDYKFYINVNGRYGWVIFQNGINEKTGIFFKGYIIGYARKDVRPSHTIFGVKHPPSFVLSVQEVGKVESYFVSDFVICEYTGIKDMSDEKIYLDDVVYDCDNMEKTVIKKKNGVYCSVPLEQDDFLTNGEKSLTEDKCYSILGNEFEGEIDQNWKTDLDFLN